MPQVDLKILGFQHFLQELKSPHWLVSNIQSRLLLSVIDNLGRCGAFFRACTMSTKEYSRKAPMGDLTNVL